MTPYLAPLSSMEKIALIILCLPSFLLALADGENGSTRRAVDVGVVLDLGNLVGKMGQTSISMAIDDFYALHGNYTTRIILHTRDSKSDVVQAASAALDLLENVEVKAIIGPQKSAQANFLSSLANKSHVPLLSFSATSPTLSSLGHTPYFVRTTLNDSSQVPAIASLIKAFGWREVVPIYEDTDYGRGIVPYLIDAFQEINTRVLYRSVIATSATDDQITEELYKLMTMETRVFIVHMSSQIGSRLFSKAKKVGMMGEGYVWIMTDGLANIVDSLDPSAISSMQGTLGVKVHVPAETKGGADEFTRRWQKRFLQEHPNDQLSEPSVFGRWAYDTVWALALAVEQVGAEANSSFLKSKTTINNSSTELEKLGVSVAGPRLLNAVLESKFTGMSGEFQIIDEQLQFSAFQIINVVGRGGRGIGFWTRQHGISRHLEPNNTAHLSMPKADLNPVIWPGESSVTPRGWENPTNGKKLRIGVPVRSSFHEFVIVQTDPITKAVTIGGYSIDVFEEVLKKLPYSLPHEYIPYENPEGKIAGSYDDLVYQVYLQKYDAVVGDTTIRFNRSLNVDFTLPYTESGVALIVPVHDNDKNNSWIFLEPLTKDLWLGSFAFFFFTGFVVWLIEHRINPEFRGPISQQLGTIFYFSFSTIVFAHRERLEHFLTRLVVIIWMFVMLVLTSSYTASLSSMLTVQQLHPTITDVHELQKNGDYVGYHKGSYIEDLLKKLNFDESKMRGYDMPEDYITALSKGSKNGGVSAIVQEIPYIKLFLAQHCTGYTMVGPIYKTAGFGFVFPKGSPLVADISSGILNVTEGDDMMTIEKKWFGDQNICLNQDSIVTSSNLNFQRFSGLFLITGAASTSCLVIFLSLFVYNNWHDLINIHPDEHIWTRMIGWFKYYNTRDQKSNTFRREESTHTNGSSDIRDKDISCALSIVELQHQLNTSYLSESESYPKDEDISISEEASPNRENQSVPIVVTG